MIFYNDIIHDFLSLHLFAYFPRCFPFLLIYISKDGHETKVEEKKISPVFDREHEQAITKTFEFMENIKEGLSVIFNAFKGH